MIKKTLILFLCLSASLFAKDKTLTLMDIINISLQNNPSIKIVSAQSKSAKAVIKETSSAYLPQLNLQAGTAYTHIDGNDIGVKTSDTDGHIFNAKLSAEQLLYDFGKTKNALKASKFNKENIDFNIISTKYDVIYNSFESYYDTLKNFHLILVQKESMQINKQLLYSANEYFKAGVKTKIDVTSAKVDYSNSELDYTVSKHNYEMSKVNMQNVMGMTPNNGEYKLDKAVVSLDDLIKDVPELPKDVQKLIKVAKEQRPDLKSAISQINASKANVKTRTSEYYPDITANADYQYYNTDDIPNLTDQYNVGVYMNWDFFSGYRTDAQVTQSRAEVIQAQSELQQLNLDIIKDVTNAYILATQKKESIKISALTANLAKENLEQAKQRYKSGLGDIVEFNDAEVKYTQARTDFVISYYDYLIALANIKRVIGDFNEFID